MSLSLLRVSNTQLLNAISSSLTSTAVGLAIGVGVEAVLPPPGDAASVSQIAVETAVQASVLGVALAVALPMIARDDPTAGIPFSIALSVALPELQRRIGILEHALGSPARSAVQKMVARTPGAA